MLLGLIEEGDGAEDPCAVDEHVHAAESVDRLGDQTLGLRDGADASAHQGHALPARVKFAQGGVQHLLATAGENNSGASVEKPAGGSLADSSSTAGDDSNLALELRHVDLLM